jgi:hypothetical protein
MISLLLWNTALAATVDGGVQVGLFEHGLQFVEERYSGEVFRFSEDEVTGQNVSCYNEVGVSNFNIEVPIDSIGLSMGNQSLVIDIHFGEIHGEEMVLFGEDDDFFDVCPSFETNFNSFSLSQGRLLVETVPTLTEDGFDVTIIGDPAVTGNLTTDIDNVPDSLIDAFIEDKILESIQTLLVERVPSIASTVLQPSLFAGQVGDIALDVELTDIQTSNTAVLVGLDVEAGWLGDGCPISGVSELPEGRSPSIDFGTGEGAAIGVGITEQQINRLFQGAWEDGLLCFDDGPLASVAETIEEAIDGTIDNGEVSILFARTPVFELAEDRANLSLNTVNLTMTGDINGDNVTLFHLEADLTLGAEVQVEHDISSFVLDLTNVSLDVIDFQANALLKDEDEVEQRMITFLEGWAVETLASRIDDVPIYGNLFHISDIFLRVTDIEIEAGAIVVMGSLYNSDDPEVDTEAPDTSAIIHAATNVNIQVEWEAEDNNNGPFAYSWRMDQGEWSDWTAEESGTISTPEPGPHELEVRARDAWLNTDETPTSILFMVAAPPSEKDKGCQCAASSSGWSTIWWLTIAAIVGTRRRRE